MDKGSEFYNKSLKSWLQDYDTEMHSTQNEGKSAVAERFIRTLKNKICKYMTSVSKNVHIDKLDGIADRHGKTYHRTIKMRTVDVTFSIYIDFGKKIMRKTLSLRLLTM